MILALPDPRHTAFWISDRLRRGVVRDAYDIAARGLGAGASDPDAFQADLLERLIRTATTTTAAYAPWRGSGQLTAFPVIDKAVIRSRQPEFRATGYASRSLHRATTSGSTGTPLAVLHSRDKRIQVRGDSILHGELAGFRIGSRLHHLKIWSARNNMGAFTRVARNVNPVDVLHFSPTQVEQLLLQIVRDPGRSGMIGYGSALATIARHIDDVADRHCLDLSRTGLTAMMAQSEALPLEARAKLARHFLVWPVGRYGLEEVGIIGQQFDAEDEYRVNLASVVVEVLRLDSDEPAAPGQLGRIVVTDLQNLAMPLIRYDTGDLGQFAVRTDGSNNRTRLAMVAGRKLDQIYDAVDRPVSSFVFYKVMWKYEGVRQFQLVQQGRATYVVKINSDPGFSEDELIRADFVEHLGAGADVRIEHVTGVPVLSSGKRRQVVGNYSPAHESTAPVDHTQ